VKLKLLALALLLSTTPAMAEEAVQDAGAPAEAVATEPEATPTEEPEANSTFMNHFDSDKCGLTSLNGISGLSADSIDAEKPQENSLLGTNLLETPTSEPEQTCQ
jgi:hypothetical protein